MKFYSLLITLFLFTAFPTANAEVTIDSQGWPMKADVKGEYAKSLFDWFPEEPETSRPKCLEMEYDTEGGYCLEYSKTEFWKTRQIVTKVGLYEKTSFSCTHLSGTQYNCAMFLENYEIHQAFNKKQQIVIMDSKYNEALKSHMGSAKEFIGYNGLKITCGQA